MENISSVAVSATTPAGETTDDAIIETRRIRIKRGSFISQNENLNYGDVPELGFDFPDITV